MPRRRLQSAPPAAPGLWPLCSDAAATLSANFVPMMAVGMIGFAGGPALVAFVTLLLSLAGFLGNGAASGQFDRLPDGLVVVFAVSLVIASVWTRGAITWLALNPSSVKCAWRAAGQRLPAMLLATCGYALCMAIGAAGLAVWLRTARIDSDLMVYPPATPALMQRAVFAQLMDAVIPDPIEPHTNVFPRLRSFAFNATVNADLLRRLRSTELKDTVVIGVPMRYAPATLESTLIPVLGLLVIVVSETMWRSRAVMVMRAVPGQVMQPLISTLRFGGAHFAAVLSRAWALHLILSAVCIAGIVLPCMMMSSQVAPALARVLGAPAIFPLCAFITSIGISVPCALLAVLSTVFDVKLVKALDALD